MYRNIVESGSMVYCNRYGSLQVGMLNHDEVLIVKGLDRAMTAIE
jgi:hypothetical protein